uniref:Uncharacterized protein n=1 Tax=Arundo donax TaxID=35708 RepID=A0A0A9BHW0_ARUDO
MDTFLGVLSIFMRDAFQTKHLIPEVRK